MKNMKKNFLLSALALLLLVGCDYNDKYFDGLDNIPIPDMVDYEGEFTADYPSDGYFTDRTALEKSVNTMLKGQFPFCDEGSTAKISVLFGDVIPGFSQADASYELQVDDYNAMGEDSGQPGAHDNFDSNMDIDAYLIAFCADKYAALEVGKVVSISYKFYATGAGVSTQIKSFKKESAGWVKVELDAYAADLSYTLEDADYDSMGEESGKPGRYNNFDSNMDVDHYLTIFLKGKYPYAAANTVANVSYLYFSGGTSTRNSFYKYDGAIWLPYDPYTDVVEITTKVANMEFDGSNWVLKRLMGGTSTLNMVLADYTLLLEWVKENKAAYLSTMNPQEEFYFGASAAFGNINNNYSTWKGHYNINGEYDGLSNDQLQLIMDERMAWGIANVILPARLAEPDSGLSYAFIYKVYSGRGAGDYKMSFMYNDESGEFELISGVTPAN